MQEFDFAFSERRNQKGGENQGKGSNPQAATFVGTPISKWITTSAKTLKSMFLGATNMNADLGGWDVTQVNNLESAFKEASSYEGAGLHKWVLLSNQVASMSDTFSDATSMTTCNKHLIAEMWKKLLSKYSNDWSKEWAKETCTRIQLTNSQFKQASYGKITVVPMIL